MNKIANRAVMCQVLMEQAAHDPDLVVLCSDSRGSASLNPYADAFPRQFVEVGIAEQNLVSIAAGMASCGRKAYAVSPASFLSARSYEQIKVDVAYSHTNVKLIGISGGISYGPLGLTHHSTNDIAALGALPGMRVYLPSDRHQTRLLLEALLQDSEPAYVRMGRNPVEDVYEEGKVPFSMDHAIWLKRGTDACIIACGEMVRHSLDAAIALEQAGISCGVLDMYCVKPLDREAVLEAARTGLLVTVEEHVAWGGLGAMVAQCVAEEMPCRVLPLTLPDAPAVAGKSLEVFRYYGLTGEGIAASVKKALGR